MHDMPDIIGVHGAGLIWDDRESKWKAAFVGDPRRQETIKLLDAVVFDDTLSAKNSEIFEIGQFHHLHLFIDLAITATPTDIQIFLQFSVDRQKWFNHAHTPWSSLIYEDTAGNKLEALHTELVAPYLRMRAVATGTTAANKFTLSLDGVFRS